MSTQRYFFKLPIVDQFIPDIVVSKLWHILLNLKLRGFMNNSGLGWLGRSRSRYTSNFALASLITSSTSSSPFTSELNCGLNSKSAQLVPDLYNKLTYNNWWVRSELMCIQCKLHEHTDIARSLYTVFTIIETPEGHKGQETLFTSDLLVKMIWKAYTAFKQKHCFTSVVTDTKALICYGLCQNWGITNCRQQKNSTCQLEMQLSGMPWALWQLADASYSVHRSWLEADVHNFNVPIGTKGAHLWDVLTKVQLAGAALTNDLVMMPMLWQHLLIPSPKFLNSRDNETSLATIILLYGINPTTPVCCGLHRKCCY